MISVVCVYNDEQTLRDNLLKGLENQTREYELILVDNRHGVFSSAAKALNWGGGKSRGKYILFIHQDVILCANPLFLKELEKFLDSIPDLGVAGFAGITDHNEKRGFIKDRVQLWEEPFNEPRSVQTLDEFTLIMPRTVFDELKFDEKTFNGWHCYGADYCLSVKQKGLNAYVIPGFIHHNSREVNTGNLLEQQRKLLNKHGRSYQHICTTCMDISWLSLKIQQVIEFIKPVFKKPHENWFPSLTDWLRKELSDCNTVLDLPYLEENKRGGILPEYMLRDIRTIEFKQNSFDAVLAWDVLQHLTKEDTYKLIGKMEKWAKKKIIVVSTTTKPKACRSEWDASKLRKMGFNVYGIKGWRVLEGYKGKLRFLPDQFWSVISQISQKLVYRFPRHASQQLAVKQVNESE